MPSVRALFDLSRGRGKPIQTVNLPLHAAVAVSRYGYLVDVNKAPRNCVGQELGICLASENSYSAEGQNLHGAEGAGATGRRHRR